MDNQDTTTVEQLSPAAQLPSWRRIVGAVAAEHGVDAFDILSDRRTVKLVAARWDAIRAVHAAYPKWSTPRLAAVFGRDHTTVLYALGRLSRPRSGRHNGQRGPARVEARA